MAKYDANTALLVVDVQNDFTDPKGTLYVAGGEETVQFINNQIARARDAGASLIYTQDWHPEHTPHFQAEGGVWPVHCVHDTWGSDFYPALDVGQESLRVRKGSGGEDGYSAFSVRDPRSGARYSTTLEAFLREHGISRIVIVGLALDYCVKESVLDARRLGFEVTVPLEGTRAVNLQPEDGDLAIQAIREAGARIE
jgi:nicotinamidase/pyrazinamidase